MHRQEILYICSHFICPFLSWQETSSACLSLSIPGPEALFLESQGLARATTSQVRCKWGIIAVPYMLSLSDFNWGILSSVWFVRKGALVAVLISHICVGFLNISSCLLSLQLLWKVLWTCFCIWIIISVMIKFHTVINCEIQIIYLQSFHQDWKPVKIFCHLDFVSWINKVTTINTGGKERKQMSGTLLKRGLWWCLYVWCAHTSSPRYPLLKTFQTHSVN